MPQYRLKSGVYDAVQYSGDPEQAEALVAAMFTNVQGEFEVIDGSEPPETAWTGNLLVQTADGETQVVAPGDWILTDTADNSRFRVSDTDFATDYEEIPA